MDEDDYLFEKLDDLILMNLWVTFITAGFFLLKKYKHRRRWWVRPINRNARHIRGHYYHLFLAMKYNDPEPFFVYTRMYGAQLDKLLKLVGPYLRRRSHRTITPSERLAMALRYLAQGGTMQTVAWEYGNGKSTVTGIIKATCEAIWAALSPKYLKKPDMNQWADIADGYNTRWNLPNCVGAIDGKLVTIQCPKKGGSLYFSYKKTHVMTLMATCDHSYHNGSYFTMVDIGGYGSQGDRAIFRESLFGQDILNGTINVPAPKNLPGTETSFSHFFVGDEAFPLRTNLMRPYPGKFLDDQRRIFNYRLSRARRTMENTFGIMAARRRVYRGIINADVSTVDAIIKSTVCLHNFLRSNERVTPPNHSRHCPPSFVDRETADGEVILGDWQSELGDTSLQDVQQTSSNNPQAVATQLRDTLKEGQN